MGPNSPNIRTMYGILVKKGGEDKKRAVNDSLMVLPINLTETTKNQQKEKEGEGGKDAIPIRGQ